MSPGPGPSGLVALGGCSSPGRESHRTGAGDTPNVPPEQGHPISSAPPSLIPTGKAGVWHSEVVSHRGLMWPPQSPKIFTLPMV